MMGRLHDCKRGLATAEPADYNRWWRRITELEDELKMFAQTPVGQIFQKNKELEAQLEAVRLLLDTEYAERKDACDDSECEICIEWFDMIVKLKAAIGEVE